MQATVAKLDEHLDFTSFDWDAVKPLGLLNKCVVNGDCRTSGKLLSFCKERVTSFRSKIGIRLCVFKIGVTSNPVVRYKSYVKKKSQVCG